MKKLVLRRETVRKLSPEKLRQAAGGMNLSVYKCAPSGLCTTGMECSYACTGITYYCQ